MDIKAFFAERPAAMDEVRRATYAYHLNHRQPKAHYFSGSWRDAECRWCGRQRWQVRWDDENPECAARPEWADGAIEDVIAREEALFERVLDRAALLAKDIDITTLTGDDLARLHHTHGVDPSMLEAAFSQLGRGLIPQALHDAYQTAYEAHRTTGKRGLVREVIVAQTK
jgi:hypothetical protein